MPATTTVLEREMYSEAGAARLLRLAPATLHYWLEGGERRGKTYKPVIREEATGSRNVTWAEFIEASFLRQYRKVHDTQMVQLRDFIEAMRQRFDVPYPLAHFRPFASGRDLLYGAQTDAGLDSAYSVVAPAGDQLVLLPAAQLRSTPSRSAARADEQAGAGRALRTSAADARTRPRAAADTAARHPPGGHIGDLHRHPRDVRGGLVVSRQADRRTGPVRTHKQDEQARLEPMMHAGAAHEICATASVGDVGTALEQLATDVEHRAQGIW